MTRNWGLPPKSSAFKTARNAKPFATLAITVAFGVLGAALAAISFNEARDLLADIFHGPSLVAAIVSGGFGCWLYLWIAFPRFAARFTGGDAFSDLLRFYCKAAIGLILTLFAAKFANLALGTTISGLMLCVSGGAAAAAAFQTVLAFVPGETPGEPPRKTNA